jgi:hypothetical protein
LFNFFFDVPVHRFSCALVHLSVRWNFCLVATSLYFF